MSVTQSLLNRSEFNKKATDQVAEAEGFVKAALDALSAHIAILDDTGRIVHVNRAWKRFGEENGSTDPNHSIGTNYYDVCMKAAAYTEDAALVAKGIRSVKLRETEEFHMEYPCHSPSQRRWYVVRVSRFSWYGVTRLIVAHQNVTDVKRVQIELEDSKRWLEAVLNSLVDGVITFDERGNLRSLNPAGSYIFGYEPADIIGRNVRLLLPTLNPDSGDATLGAFIENIGGLGDEVEGQRRDGTIFPMYFAVSQVIMDGQRLFTAIVQDFTERKFLESQLWDKERLNLALEKERELRDLKNRFISMMSHDLRTPLATIQLANSMLQQYGDRSTEEEKQESYETINQQVEYLNEMIADVLTISRTDFTGTELELEIVDLETYCRDILEGLQMVYRSQRHLIFNGTDRRVEVRMDRKLMRRAVTNLLTNAIKYSPDNKPVMLEVTCGDGTAVIRVKDQGIGIPEEDQKRLFEPFHRAANVGKIQGTGLGLAIAKQAVDLHGGEIYVESKIGAGTTFVVKLRAEKC